VEHLLATYVLVHGGGHGHDPMITEPDAVTAALLDIASARSD
jgi:hypothetical protein